ncbi:MAG TPA: hypothetical protein VJJ81_03080 [Candidatus Babeliales bacterium]|nr:hypothetical protein [Candidatus Babeliales bacterium]
MDLSFGVNKVIQKLRRDQISGVQQLWYLVIYVLFTNLSILMLFGGNGLISNLSSKYKLPDYSANAKIAIAILMLVEIGVCYVLNRRGDNRDFILRYIVLYLSIMWRFIVVMILMRIVGIEQLFERLFGCDAYLIILELSFFGLLFLAFRQVAGKK